MNASAGAARRAASKIVRFFDAPGPNPWVARLAFHVKDVDVSPTPVLLQCSTVLPRACSLAHVRLDGVMCAVAKVRPIMQRIKLVNGVPGNRTEEFMAKNPVCMNWASLRSG